MNYTLHIMGYPYAVSVDSGRESLSACARCNTDRLTIRLANDIPKEQQESTLVHEAIEALNYHLDLKLDEPTIMRLESGLYQFLVANGVDLSPLVR
jgi:hypothetical protein